MYIHVYSHVGSKEASATTGSTGGAGATSSGTGGGKQTANTKTCEVCVCVCVYWLCLSSQCLCGQVGCFGIFMTNLPSTVELLSYLCVHYCPLAKKRPREKAESTAGALKKPPKKKQKAEGTLILFIPFSLAYHVHVCTLR